MSEELLQTSPIQIGRYSYYKLGASTLRQLKNEGIVKATVPKCLLAKKPDGLIWLFDVSSDYGWSLPRALVWWSGHWLIMAVLLFEV